MSSHANPKTARSRSADNAPRSGTNGEARRGRVDARGDGIDDAVRRDPIQLADLTPDLQNRRAHTPRNLAMIVDALQQVGAARSIVIDEDDVVLAGNGVIAAAADAGIT